MAPACARRTMRLTSFMLCITGALGCPIGYYLSTSGVSCTACEPCVPPFSILTPCGPGPQPGLCGSGLRVTLFINDTVDTLVFKEFHAARASYFSYIEWSRSPRLASAFLFVARNQMQTGIFVL